MRRLLPFVAALALTLLSAANVVPARAEGCSFVLGFAALHALIPQRVGTCLEDEGHDAATGDAIQHTTGGLLVWRRADNWTAFTDGASTWVNGPNGLQERPNGRRFRWEANPQGLPLAGAGAGAWTTYHGGLARDGVDPDGLAPSSARVAWQAGPLDGDAYAEPLMAGGRVFVATENDSVYALNAATGAVAWRQHVGTPVEAASLPCGNIGPTVGITGTPVVDPASNTLYAVAFAQPAHHELVALDLETGAVRFRRGIDPPGADPTIQLQRAALALSQGNVYVAFGGRFGDCGAYHGWVVGARADGTGELFAYRVPTEREGGFWASSGPAVDPQGNVYVTAGNGSSSGAFDYGNAVIRLGPDLRQQDYFAPTDWRDLNDHDADLGSVGPTLLDDGLLFQIGKTGVGYLLRADHLGGIGGELFSNHVCNAAFGGTAYAAPMLYVPCTDGIRALRVDPSGSFSVAWHGPGFFAGPPIVSGGAVWTLDTYGGTLYALDMQTGQVAFSAQVGRATHFAAPASGSGEIVVAAGRRVIALEQHG